MQCKHTLADVDTLDTRRLLDLVSQVRHPTRTVQPLVQSGDKLLIILRHIVDLKRFKFRSQLKTISQSVDYSDETQITDQTKADPKPDSIQCETNGSLTHCRLGSHDSAQQ